MTVEFTQDAEVTRVNNKVKPMYAYLITSSLVHAVHKAKEMGWGDKKVQVRLEMIGTDTVEYHVEPFEKDCGCPNMLRYSDFFL